FYISAWSAHPSPYATVCLRNLVLPATRSFQLRVLYLVTKADLGGAQVHILDLLRGFQSVLEPVVAVGAEGYFTAAVQKLGVPCEIVPSLVHPIAPADDCRAL